MEAAGWRAAASKKYCTQPSVPDKPTESFVSLLQFIFLRQYVAQTCLQLLPNSTSLLGRGGTALMQELKRQWPVGC